MLEDDPPPICRELFSAINDFVYLDTATLGLSTPFHAQAAAAFFNEGKRLGSVGRRKWEDKATQVRQKIAAWMNVKPDEIYFSSGTTDALNLIGYSVDWKKHDEIVMADDEFSSVKFSWQAAEKAGARLRKVNVESERTRESQLLDALNTSTRALAVSQVHTYTGTRLNLELLGAACRENDILFIVDGIHAFGVTPPTLAKVDIYAAGIFKWMLAGFGLGVCVVKRHAREQLTPGFRGYMNSPPSESLQFAHINSVAVYTLDASLEVLGSIIGWETVHRRTAGLVQALADELAEADIQIVSPAQSRAGIASFLMDNPEAVRVKLQSDNIHVAARGPYLRVSPYFYNSLNDVQILARQVIRYCR